MGLSPEKHKNTQLMIMAIFQKLHDISPAVKMPKNARSNSVVCLSIGWCVFSER
jgi:hypothetical protein